MTGRPGDRRFSRREILKRLGLAGAAAAALPDFSRVLIARAFSARA